MSRGRNVNIIKVDLSERTVATLAIAVSFLAIGIGLMAIVFAYTAERESKLLREDVRIMQIALAHHGIDTDEHATEKGRRNDSSNHH